MPESIVRAAGYRRVSKQEQLEGHSLEAQATNITAHAASHGWTLVDIYTEAGTSAKRGSARPTLESLLANAAQGQFDVIVDKIDRFYRHPGGLLVALDRLHEANVAVGHRGRHPAAARQRRLALAGPGAGTRPARRGSASAGQLHLARNGDLKLWPVGYPASFSIKPRRG